MKNLIKLSFLIVTIVCATSCYAQTFVENFVLETDKSLSGVIHVTKATDGTYKVVLESEDSLFNVKNAKEQALINQHNNTLKVIRKAQKLSTVIDSVQWEAKASEIDSLLKYTSMKDTASIKKAMKTHSKDSVLTELSRNKELDSLVVKSTILGLQKKLKGVSAEFSLKPFEKELFMKLFKKQFILMTASESVLESKASELFFKANAYIEIIGENGEPDAGQVRVNNCVPLYSYDTDLQVGYLGIDQVDFEIYEGYIQNIMVSTSDSICNSTLNVSASVDLEEIKKQIFTGIDMLKQIRFKESDVTKVMSLNWFYRWLSLKRKLAYVYKNYDEYNNQLGGVLHGLVSDRQLIPAYIGGERRSARRIYRILRANLKDIKNQSTQQGLRVLNKANPRIQKLAEELRVDYKNVFFENKIPVGFSHKNNYTNLYQQRLFCVNPKYKGFYIKLGEVMSYKYEVAEERRDFSPRNGRYKVLKNQTVMLKKIATKKILEVNVFSDFLGFKKDNPNGLVQLEFNKRINTNTYKRQAYKSDLALIQYLVPSFTYNKFEDKENAFVNTPKVVPLQDTLMTIANRDTARYIGNGLVSEKYQLTPVDLLRYQQFSVGIEGNMAEVTLHPLKTTLSLNGGLRFGQSRIVDSLYAIKNDTLSKSSRNTLLKRDISINGLVSESKVNTLQWLLEASVAVTPELRYGVKATYRIMGMNLFTDQYELVGDRGGRARTTAWLHQAELFGYFNPSSNGKLFFRYRFNFNYENLNYNFSQLQLGYSFYLVK